MELGSWAEWVSATGAIIALIAAFVAAWQAIRANSHQGEQLRRLEAAEQRREDEAERRDAERVAFWPAIRPSDPDPNAVPLVYYANRSGLPIYELLLRVAIPGAQVDVEYHSLGPLENSSLSRVQRRLLRHADEAGPVDWGDLMTRGEFRCAAVFRDTAGRWWFRDPDGLLTPTPFPTRDAARAALDEATATR